jgi:hypothetical protein
VRVANDPKFDRPSFIGKAFRIDEGEPVSIRLATPAIVGPHIELDDPDLLSEGIVRIDPPHRSGNLSVLGFSVLTDATDNLNDMEPLTVEITSGRTTYVEKIFPDLAGQRFRYYFYAEPQPALIFCGIHGWVRPNGKCPH